MHKEKPSLLPNESIQPILLDIKAAAQALNSTVWAVRQLLWAGKLPFVKLGKKYLIDPADLRAFVEREKERAA